MRIFKVETLSTSEKLTEAEAEAYQKLVPRYKESAVEIESFTDLYGPETIKKDKQAIEELERKFEESDKRNPERADYRKRGELLEAILAEQIELEDWLGPEAQTITPSRYDDIFNHVDLTVEFANKGFVKYLALSIDATTSRQEIAQKIDIIRKDIQDDHLTSIKYFSSGETGLRGKLEDIPRVVIGADVNTIRELAGLWLNLEKTKARKTELEKDLDSDSPEILEIRAEIKSLNTKLAGHRIQLQILKEIKLQLDYFITLTQSQNKTAIEKKYQNALQTIDQILEEKRPGISKEEEIKMEQDVIYQTILQEVSH